MEQDRDIALVLGMYEMTEQNTPGLGNVLRKYGLAMLPEAHCYLRTGGKRIDLTRDIGRGGRREEIVGFLYEEDIDPNQITHYKPELHKRFLSHWIVDNTAVSGRSVAEVWSIREECVAIAVMAASPVLASIHVYKML